MQVLNRLRNTETCSDNWANRVLPELHLCSLSRVYQEQRTESGYILYLPKAVFLLEVWLGQIACCSAWWQGSLFQEKSWHVLRRRCGSLWICSGAGCLLGWIYAEGLNDPAFLPQPKSWFHLVPLGKREQSWPRIVVALRDILNGGSASYGSFLQVFCKVGWWCRPPFPPACTQRCSRGQLLRLPSGN